MLVYLLKFSVCLAIFMVFYKLFLERENMHHIKRYYLLAALILSLGIPFVTFIQYIEPTVTETFVQSTGSFVSSTEIEDVPTPINYIPIILWSIYGLGFLIFGLKFSLNLFQILKRIKRNPKLKKQSFVNVLLTDLITPHTFFRYIFLNKKKYEAQEIPQEVFIHEQTHAQQKHSIDVLFIELLQVVLWFNPLLYFIKKDIKLNHEFLADQAVLKNGIQPSVYQKLLLAFSSDAQNAELANAINYSSIKKRFTVMKTNTSQQKIWLRSLLLLPLVALTLYGFSNTKIIEKQNLTTNPLSEDDNFSQYSKSEEKPNRRVEIAGLITDSESLLPLEKVQIYDTHGNFISSSDANGYFKVSLEIFNEGDIKFEFSLQKNNYEPLIQKEHWGNLSDNTKSIFYFGLKEKGSQAIQLSELFTNSSNLDYQSVAENFQSSKSRFKFEKKLNNLKKNNQLVLFKIENDYYLVNNSGWIRINSITDKISINEDHIIPASKINSIVTRDEIMGMTPLENKNSLFAIYTEARYNSKNQQKATPEEVEEYNKLAKHYNSQPEDHQIIKLKDMKRLKEIYDKMNKQQRVDAEPLPNFPPPPPPLSKDDAPQVVQMHDLPPPPPPPIPDNATPEQRRTYQNAIDMYDSQKEGYKYKHKTKDGKLVDVVVIPDSDKIAPPPPPPVPKSPLDHVIEMAKKGATFYFENKLISSDEAINLLKKDKELNISTKQSDSKQPKVYISKDPITIKD